MRKTQHDAHMVPWLARTFGLTVRQNDNYGFDCWEGDYDLDAHMTSDEEDVFSAAVEWASCYRGVLFDALIQIETGKIADLSPR